MMIMGQDFMTVINRIAAVCPGIDYVMHTFCQQMNI